MAIPVTAARLAKKRNKYIVAFRHLQRIRKSKTFLTTEPKSNGKRKYEL